jgi:hypothetical protein
MDEKPHTFDLNGDVMWVEPPNMAKLPSMVQTISHYVAKDKKDKKPLASDKMDDMTPPKPKAKQN